MSTSSIFSPQPILADKRSDLEFSSLLHLRWGAIICQILLIIIVGTFLRIPIPFFLVSAILFFETASNLLFHYLKNSNKSMADGLFAAIMLADVGLLTLLLSQTGGTMNPFTLLYLLHIVIGAILMPAVWAWGLALFTVLCYASFFIHAPFSPPALPHPPPTICLDTFENSLNTVEEMELHLKGMLVAFTLTSFFIVYFIGRIRQALAGHNKMVAQLEDQRLRNEKLASLATLAAGTAHEFATPLSTIKLAAGEILYAMKNQAEPAEILDDIELIRRQIQKCEEILNQMTEDAGDPRGGNFVEFTIQALLERIVAMLPEKWQALVAIEPIEENIKIHAPLTTICRALKGVVENGLDAALKTARPRVTLSTAIENGFLVFTVTDNGAGMDPVTLGRATEPFFTTKETGQGMGLGLFVARAVAERFGGALSLQSKINQGTEVTVRLSLAKLS